jgi:hypothetical protein
MGTRGSTFVQLDGQYKVAQYGQWDHYPSGQGAIALHFLHSLKTESDLQKFRQKVRALIPITEKELEDRWVECGAARDASGISFGVSDRMKAKYPHLQRDCGAKVLELIAKDKIPDSNVQLDLEFPKDSLFCEWAYVIDLDKNTFEVYKGFNKRPLLKNARFYFDGYHDDKLHDPKEYNKKSKGKPYHYYPIRLKKSYRLDKLPSLGKLILDCEGKEAAAEWEKRNLAI